MSGDIYKPTMKLMWFEAGQNNESPTAIEGNIVPDCAKRYVLKQLWISESGNDKWEIIPTKRL